MSQHVSPNSDSTSFASADRETVLIVDDEEPVRRTFTEWLSEANLGVRVLAASGAAEALTLANDHTIDLAILDWNLGAGNDGLQLLEDLFVFNPDVVAVMITGYAHQATPLAAMRMGIRDYLDKNQDLDQSTFLRAVRRQLERIRPARQQRRLHAGLIRFRDAVEHLLPLVQTAAALQDPLSPPQAIASLFRFLLRATGAREGVLLVRQHDPERAEGEVCQAYNPQGERLPPPPVPFARSLAGTAVCMGSAQLIQQPIDLQQLAVELQPFEQNRTSMLVAPLSTDAGLQAVLELFDKPGEGFTASDRNLMSAAAEFAGELLRHALSDRQAHHGLFEAIHVALRASDWLRQSLDDPLSADSASVASDLLQQLGESMRGPGTSSSSSTELLHLAELIRRLSARHGTSALRFCAQLVEQTQGLLDAVAGEEVGP